MKNIYKFNRYDAEKYGVNCAIILEELFLSIMKSKDDQSICIFSEKKYWVKRTVNELTTSIPFLKITQLRAAINKLTKLKVIESRSDLNGNSMNKSKWYSFSEEEYKERVKIYF